MSFSLAVLGLGMMGGSVALAARARGSARVIAGWDPCAKACAKALATGIIDRVEMNALDAVADADMVVLACPVPVLADLAREIGPACAKGCVVTDLGSTKASILQAIDGFLPGGTPFVGSHPIAGSEKNGCAHSEATLFEGKITVICPGQAPEAAVTRVESFWNSLGSKTMRMDHESHDKALAATSHLPHLLAFLLAGLPDEGDKPFVGGGFRDTTRIAGSDPDLWTGILLDNKARLLPLANAMIASLTEARDCLQQKSGDSKEKLRALLTRGHRFRVGLEESQP